MVIAPHMIIGAAVGVWAPSYGIAFLLGLASHFLVDSLPHWDYLKRIDVRRFDHMAKISLDFIIGLIIVFWLVWPIPAPQKWIAFSTALVVLLPDCLEAFYRNFQIKFLTKFLKKLSDFHHGVHRAKRYTFWQALPISAVLIAVAIALIVDKWP